MRLAITRAVSAGIARCELTHLTRQPIDVDLARRQHDAYEQRLIEAGYPVTRLPAGADLPDSVFIEDIAVVFDELAIVTRPGAAARRAETAAVAAALRPLRPLHSIEAPGTIDGGDVLIVGRSVFVGESGRTNDAAITQMRALLAPHGYTVTGVAVRGCLHLKSAVTAIADDTLLINRDWAPAAPFQAFRLLDVDAAEPMGANALRLHDRVVYPLTFPRTRAGMEQHGIRVVGVDVGEIAKAEGAVTCCSLIVG
ncbi:MAG: dimethylargininase [Acidobacteriota bacterium]